MVRDLVQDSLLALAEGVPTAPARLSRRHRSAVLALDVNGDVAATLIARRSVGCVQAQAYLFQHHQGTWTYLGGGGGPSDDLFAPRPEPTPAGEHLHSSASGGARGAFGWRKPWISEVELRCSPHVDVLDVAGRIVPVAAHGNAVIVWSSSRAPVITALDSQGRPLHSYTPRAPH